MGTSHNKQQHAATRGSTHTEQTWCNQPQVGQAVRASVVIFFESIDSVVTTL
ncbi:MAG: hypothetical protein PHQ05_13870 [Sterolibacterium sp.]|nr:hypothetical protein [Sterolibacterium sp.]